MKIDLVSGARPNFMKLSPVHRALVASEKAEVRVLHTGQHYDRMMSDVFFDELGLPEPTINLGVGSGAHGQQTAEILSKYETVLLESRPDACVVFGDVNSTVACGLAAAKLDIPLAHVEAGLRSFDRQMPEEVNRVMTDSIADLLFVTEQSGLDNLRREGVPQECVRLVGNTMIDTLMRLAPQAKARAQCRTFGAEPGAYILATMHRPFNVDDPATLRRLLACVESLSVDVAPIVLSLHPRTLAAAKRAGIDLKESAHQGALRVIGPQGYIDNLSMMSDALAVLTDSGGMQEECAALRKPCITMRPSTERPSTILSGASRLVGNDTDAIRAAVVDVAEGRWPEIKAIPAWDGHAGERVAQGLLNDLDRAVAARGGAPA